MTWKPILLGGLAVLSLTPVSAIWSPRPSIVQSPPIVAMDAAVTETARQMLTEGRRPQGRPRRFERSRFDVGGRGSSTRN
jgi:hypothetical protein